MHKEEIVKDGTFVVFGVEDVKKNIICPCFKTQDLYGKKISILEEDLKNENKYNN